MNGGLKMFVVLFISLIRDAASWTTGSAGLGPLILILFVLLKQGV